MTAPAEAGTRERTDALKARALALGFVAVGVARLDAPAPADDPAGGRYRAWLARGDHAGMDWLTRLVEERTHPQTMWPGARSLVAVAWNYWRGDEPDGHAAGFARFARGRDYHRAVGTRLRALARAALTLWPGCSVRVSVDTGPILERTWAERAGVGFLGKHNHLVQREAGNWAMLGELLLDVELAPDTPAERRCGSCRRCLDACPTDALPEPYRLDAGRCISYLTIESAAPIPLALRSRIGQRIFGCDDCLDACPWNRFAQDARLDEVRARPGLLATPLADWLALDEAAFVATFTGTAVLRAGRDGFLRNVCVALGNRRDPADVPALARALDDASPLVREHAQWALEQITARAGSAA